MRAESDFDADVVLFTRNGQFYNRISIAKVTLANGIAELLAMETMSARPVEDKAAISLGIGRISGAPPHPTMKKLMNPTGKWPMGGWFYHIVARPAKPNSDSASELELEESSAPCDSLFLVADGRHGDRHGARMRSRIHSGSARWISTNCSPRSESGTRN